MELRYVKGIGEKKAGLFAKLGLLTLDDLCRYYPRNYEDRSRRVLISELVEGESFCVAATVGTPVTQHTLKGGRPLARAQIFDDSGVMDICFFNAPYIKNTLRCGESYVFYGKAAMQNNRLGFVNPDFELSSKAGAKTGRILPVYRTTAGLGQQTLRSLAHWALVASPSDDPIPQGLRDEYALVPLQTALEHIHFPPNEGLLENARRRLVFEELLVLQLGLLGRRGSQIELPGLPFPMQDMAEFWQSLPFAPTEGQEQAVADIIADIASGKGMNRLIQGDVGSGKTVVAAAAAYLSLKNGWQTALMVPTEILAEQHMQSLTPLFAALGGRTALLTGKGSAKVRAAVREQVAKGDADLVIGTHALLSDTVRFARLGLVITDEQHRFGVAQRARLFAKGDLPHRLIMSATPIPRTLARIIFGDLDVTQMHGLPPGRTPVRTFVVEEDMRPRIEAFVRKTVAEGAQVYIVCPLIEDELGLGLKAADDYAKTLRDETYKDLRVGLLHGKLKAAQREAVMASFAAGETDILVATTVIEVGVNVPNASLMVVENAEHFGLSQLHQLRGRVGRGARESHCVLFLQTKGDVAKQRMNVMRQTHDGFVIAEADLRLRGPGDFFGRRQHGLPEFRIADLSGDMAIMEDSRKAAVQLTSCDPGLQMPEHQRLRMMTVKIMDSLEGGD